MSDNINMDGQVVPVVVQSYMDWERPAAINAEQKKDKKKKKCIFQETSMAVLNVLFLHWLSHFHMIVPNILDYTIFKKLSHFRKSIPNFISCPNFF